MEGLSTKRIEDVLSNQHFYDIYVEEVVDSTNTFMKQRAEEGAKEGTVLIALEQTAGRGRLGRSFLSPKGSGIYMSILFKPNKSADKSLILTSAAALSVCKAIREIAGLDANIKWVNDILLDEKKVCGILAEGKIASEAKMEYVVLGIGINIKTPEGGFTDEIKDIATSLENSTTKDLAVKLVAKILDNLYFYYEDMDLNEEYIQ